MIYGLYRGGYGDLYRVERGSVAGYVLLKNLNNRTSSYLEEGEVQAHIDNEWLKKLSVSDLGGDATTSRTNEGQS